MKKAVNFADPRDVADWINGIAALAEDLIDLADEALKPRDERVISKPALRRDLDTAARKAQRLIRAARRGNRKRTST